jgi:hypothetical protein
MITAATADVEYHVPYGDVNSSNDVPRDQRSWAREFFTTDKPVYVA